MDDHESPQPKRAAFLAAYAKLGNISAAALAAGIDRGTHYDWMLEPEYAKAFAAAKEDAVDYMESEALRRAVTGVDRPVYQGGEMVGTVREYSDTLLIFLLKGAAPKKYRERLSIGGDDGGHPLVFNFVEKSARSGD